MGSGENLDIALGAPMAVLPGVGLLSLVWQIGICTIFFGIALIVLALRARGLQNRAGRRAV